MDFGLTQEQKEIQQAAREFAQGEFDKEKALEFELNHEFPKEIWKKACELGFIAAHLPEEYGGQEIGTLESLLVTEEFCRADSGIGIAVTAVGFCSDFILVYGNEEQKKKVLPLIPKGEAITAGAFTEPDHGSDLASISTIAKKEGDEYVINGSKIFITNGSYADYFMVLCKTDQDVKPEYKGMSVIIVEKGTKGFEVTEIKDKMGLSMMSTAELSFDNVRVPVENLIGQENKGFYYAMEFFAGAGRIGPAIQALGIGQGAFDRALDYVKNREQFGRKIAEFQVTQHKLADMATKLETARLLSYKAAWSIDQGRVDPKLISMAKYYATLVGVEVCYEAIQLFGGYGYITEYEVERFYRDVRITEIWDGTKEIQKNIIAGAIIGKLR